QKIAKKAIIESLKRRYKQETFPENGPRFPIDVAILNDQVSLILDTTGPSLHKRGYRSDAGEAPLKETLAAALVMLSRWDPSRVLADPLCGSGTILIEAALLATNRPPGLRREFQAQAWPWMPKELWFKNRQQAKGLIQPGEFRLLGSDTDSRVLAKARENAENAGVAELVSFQTLPMREFRSRKRYGVWISNPPYGLRLSERKELNVLYEEFKQVWSELSDWSYFLLSADAELEQRLGRKASKRRKLFNGQIACQYYQFFGPRPERNFSESASEPEA
ncbi:MAG: class I SAM-dependent RNA methyltransferase, partial [Candidatus Sericytochromatia bacterium]